MVILCWFLKDYRTLKEVESEVVLPRMRVQIRSQPQQLQMSPLHQLLDVLRDVIPVLAALLPAVGRRDQVRVERCPVSDAELAAEVEEGFDAALVVVEGVGPVVPGPMGAAVDV